MKKALMLTCLLFTTHFSPTHSFISTDVHVHTDKKQNNALWRLTSSCIDLGLLSTCMTSGTLSALLYSMINAGMFEGNYIRNTLVDGITVSEYLPGILKESPLETIKYSSIILAGVSASALGLLLLKRSYSKENSKRHA